MNIGSNIIRKTKVAVLAVVGIWLLLLAKSTHAQCVGVYNESQLRDAIQTAKFYNSSTPTLITVCNDFKVGNLDMSNRNIKIRCDKTQNVTSSPQRKSRCIFDADSSSSIFTGYQTKLFVVGANFINARGSAFYFYPATVIVQRCSFSNNAGDYGGAIFLQGFNSNLTIRGGSRPSPNLFYNNTALARGGAIYSDGPVLLSDGYHTIFTSNSANFSGGAIEIKGVDANSNLTGVTFLNNNVEGLVSTKRSNDFDSLPQYLI
jgi:predicted outer membrane repeat protein